MARRWSGGHASSILCVGASGGPEGLLASGSEGGGVTVWSQEGAIVGRLALPGEDDCTGATFAPAAPAQLFVSHGEAVSVLDPRNLKGPVETFTGAGEEEINALALNETGSALAVADDSGAVRVLELPGGKVCRTLRRHSNICSSVTFRPQRPQNLLSAGLDMQVMLWGLQKTRPLWTVNLQDAGEEEEPQQPGQLFNPPLVHCVSVASCGNIVGCAAEDGRVHLLRVGGGCKLEQQGAVRAHSQGASQAHFMDFLSHPYWLVSGGNDGRVALWELAKHPVVSAEVKAAAPRRRSKRGGRTPPKAEGGGAEKGEGEESAPKVTFSHGDKVNWLCPAFLKGAPSVVVADQSSSLTVYPLTP